VQDGLSEKKRVPGYVREPGPRDRYEYPRPWMHTCATVLSVQTVIIRDTESVAGRVG
jgi:hypothetical protein